ncbi:helix-turn-helix domain-containing protein [Streptomyces sp. NPDC059071]|uniref:helix-turn-helix domain-containing protein n=1 Tax=unclassified Streptomyces TaxID=2593676 RepID=UPI00366A0D01
MATTDNPTTGPVWDWSAGHGPVTGALSATTGAFALATTGAATGMPPTWAMAVGAAGAIGHTISTLRERLSARTIALRASSWLLGAGWTTWAMANGPLTWTAIGSLAVLGVGIGTAARSVGFYEDARELELISWADQQVARELQAERRTLAAEWVDRVQRVCGITLTVLAIEKWPTGTGFTIDAELPGGTTYNQIAKDSARLSADARLPHGCTVAATPGIHQGRVLIDVSTVNVLAGEIPYPAEYGPLSIHTGLPWGVRSDGREIPVYLREQCALVVGPTGSGKTNFSHTVLAGFARATDVLTWVIDLNAGSAGLPWVRPAFDGDGHPDRETRPGIDWLASTSEEAELMLDAALRVGKHRKVVYQDLMAQGNTDLLPISAQIPQIMLVVDEGAEILASNDPKMRKLAAKILEVIRLLRAMGIRTVLTALGATGSVLGNLMIRREAKARVVLTGGEVEGMDLSRIFQSTQGLKPEQAPYKGAGFIGTPESAPGLFKSWRITPNQIADIVRATSTLHPRLDAESAQAAGPAYARRWDTTRTAWMRTSTVADERPAPAAENRPTRPGGLNLSALRDTPAPAAAATDEDALAARFMAQIDAEFGTTTEPNPDGGEQREERRGLNLSAFRSGQKEGAAQQAALDVLLAAGAEGTGASAIARALAEEHGTSRQTVVGWLKEWAEEGIAVRIGNGTKTRYVHHRHAPSDPTES